MEENKNIESGKEQKSIPEETISPSDESAPQVEQYITHSAPPLTERDMKVHHHTHASRGKKNWKTYFWEFLMLFPGRYAWFHCLK